MDDTVSRRGFLAFIAGSAGAAWLATHSNEVLAAVSRVAAPQALPQLKVLNVDTARDIEAAAAQIVPSGGGLPGAREARVVYFMDQALATFAAAEKKDFDTLARELRSRASRRGARSFAALSDNDQVRALREMEKDSERLFELLRSTTLVGMFAHPSYGGNANKAGWKLLGFDDRFSWIAPFGYYDAQPR